MHCTCNFSLIQFTSVPLFKKLYFGPCIIRKSKIALFFPLKKLFQYKFIQSYLLFNSLCLFFLLRVLLICWKWNSGQFTDTAGLRYDRFIGIKWIFIQSNIAHCTPVCPSVCQSIRPILCRTSLTPIMTYLYPNFILIQIWYLFKWRNGNQKNFEINLSENQLQCNASTLSQNYWWFTNFKPVPFYYRVRGRWILIGWRVEMEKNEQKLYVNY